MPNLHTMRVPLLIPGAKAVSSERSAFESGALHKVNEGSKMSNNSTVGALIESNVAEVSRPGVLKQTVEVLGLDILWERLAEAWGRPGVNGQSARRSVLRAGVTEAPRSVARGLRQRRGTPPAPWAWPNRMVTDKH